MVISFLSLIFSIYRGIFIGYPLILVFLIFAFMSYRRGFSIKEIVTMSYSGGKKALIVVRIFVLIGAITSIWMASGTVPSVVYYGIKLLNPNLFILYSFLISCLVSFLLGTSFGTVSTVGISLMIMARSGNINVNIVAGAIMAGSYFGDRCSPMSSSANLVAHITDTNLYTNIKNMFRTASIPFFISVILYSIISIRMPLDLSNNNTSSDILSVFNISFITLLPATIILLLSLFKVDVKLSMLISILTASIIAIFVQGYDFGSVLRYIVFGYKIDIDTPLRDIIKGGGVLSMWKVMLVVFVSSCMAGIFEKTGILKNVEDILMKTKSRANMFIFTVITSILTAGFGCNQAIAIILTNQLVKKAYSDKYELSVDIENSGVVIAPLIPWNIAGLVPTTTLMVSSFEFIPYAFYLYLIPIVNIVYLKFTETQKRIKLA
ncbi:Na+/H+ antiporter NhaC family protein [Alkalithermobacter paradoxus]